MKTASTQPLRPVIVGALVVCVAVALAPWRSGGQDAVAMLVSGAFVLLALLLVWRQPAVRQLRRGPVLWVFLAVLGWAGVSWLWTANHFSTITWVVTWALAGLIFRLSYVLAAEPQGREWLLRAYMASAVVFCLDALWLYMTGDYNRLTGSFYWANPAAAYLIPAILLAADRLLAGEGRRERWLWGGLLSLYGVSFWLADSRGGVLVLLVMLGLYLLMRRPARPQWVLLVFSLIAVLGVGNAMVQIRHFMRPDVAITAPGSRFTEAALGESQSGSDRLRFMSSGVQMWLDRPVGGVGAGAYGDVHPQYQERVVSAATNAHNFYVQVLAELGFVGAVLLMWLLWALGAGVVRGWRSQGRPALVLGLGLVGLALHFGVDIDASYPALLWLAAALAGLLYTQPNVRRVAARWPAAALAGLALVPLVSLYMSQTWADRGRASQDLSQYEEAASNYNDAYSWPFYNPDTINAEGINYYSLALVEPARRAQEAALALDRAQRAVREDPEDAQHRQLEGRVLALEGRWAEAELALQTALRLDPYNHPSYAVDLANVLRREGKNAEALAVARAMADQYDDAVLNNRAADQTVKPSVAGLWVVIGDLEVAVGDTAAAQTAAARAVKLAPTSRQALDLQRVAAQAAQ